MDCRYCNAENSVVSSGINQTGLIVFILLILFCLPLCWLPFVMDSMKKKVCKECGREIA